MYIFVSPEKHFSKNKLLDRQMALVHQKGNSATNGTSDATSSFHNVTSPRFSLERETGAMLTWKGEWRTKTQTCQMLNRILEAH